MAKKLITLNIDEDVIEALDKTAEELRMNRSAYVNMLLAGITAVESGNTLGAMKRTLATIAASRQEYADEITDTIVSTA